MKNKCFWMTLMFLIFLLNFSYLANADTTLPSNSATAPVDSFMLNFSWSNSSTNGYNFTNITFTLPTNLTAISGYNATNSTNVTSFNISNQNVYFGNGTNWTNETAAWFAFNISSNSSGVYNITVNETYVNTTNPSDVSVVPVNVTLTISKGSTSITLYINGSSSNRTFNTSDMINLTAASNVDGLNVSLSLNNYTSYGTGYGDNFQINLSSSTNLTNASLQGLGVFNFSAQVIGNENYSSSSLGTLYFFVANLYSNSSPVTYAPNAGYNFSIKFPVNVSNAFLEANFNGTTLYYYTGNTSVTNWNKNITMYNDTNGSYWVNFTDLPANTSYNYYKWVANYSNSLFNTSQLTYTVNPIPVYLTLVLSPSNTTSPPSYTVGTAVTITCNANVSSNPTLYVDGSAYTSTSTSATNTTNPTSARTVSTSCYVLSSNYTANTPGFSISFISSSQNQNQNPTSQLPTFTFAIQNLTSSVSVNAGSTVTASFGIKNTYQYAMTVSITLKNISSSWYSLSKNGFSIASINGTEQITINFNIPSNANAESYAIKVNATGTSSGGIKSSDEKSMTLIVNPGAQSGNQSNQTNQTNETENLNNTSNANETNMTTAAANINNNSSLAWQFINTPDFRNVVLFVGLLISGIIFIFRNNITSFLTKGKVKTAVPHAHLIHEHPPQKKNFFSSLRGRISSLNQHKIIVHLKKKDKEKA